MDYNDWKARLEPLSKKDGDYSQILDYISQLQELDKEVNHNPQISRLTSH